MPSSEAETRGETMKAIRVVKLTGSPYEMGWEHGKRFHDEIHMFTEERVRLSQELEWTGRSLERAAVIALAEACVAEHQAYAPDLMEELQGIADATNLSLAEMVINNGFTDFIDVVYNLGDITVPAVTPAISLRQLHSIHGTGKPQRHGQSVLRSDLGYARFRHALRDPDSRNAR